MNLVSPSEHQLLVFWVAMVVLVGVARLLGALARRVGQPAVIGELAAGLVLGPSILGRVAPDAFEWLFPRDDVQSGMLFTVGWLGVVFLLVVTGYETDLGLIRRLGRAAGIVSTGSLVVPMLAGLVTGLVMPSLFLGGEGDRTVFALFLASALSISSLPVIAKILTEMGFMRRDFGQLTLAAGMANDVVGWVLLGLVAGLAQAGAIELGALVTTLVGLAVFFAATMTLGQRLLDAALRRLRLSGAPHSASTGVLLLAALALGSITQWLGVEAVLGAFVAGILLGRSKLRDERMIAPIETVTATFLAPVFFATAGLRVDLGLLSDPTVLFWAVVVLLVASLAKFVGSVAAARLAGMPNREGAALGVGLNARGALEIVIATVGLSLGVLNQASYTVIVLMAMATSMAAPPLLRKVLAGWHGTEEEQNRLRLEEALESNLLVRAEPILLPTRGGMNSIMAAQLVDLAWPAQVPVALLSVHRDRPPDLSVLHDVLYQRPVEERTVTGDEPVERVLSELTLGYGAAAIGVHAPENGDDGDVLSPFAAEVCRSSPVPVVIVRRGPSVQGRLPAAYGRMLVPVAGTAASQAAQELGFNISASIGTEAVLAHVVHADGNGDADGTDGVRPTAGGIDVRTRPAGSLSAIGERLLDEAVEGADRLGARSTTDMVEAESTAVGILQLVDRHDTDLVILGTTRRDVEGRLFLGHTVERILRQCDATVVVVVTPREAGGEP